MSFKSWDKVIIETIDGQKLGIAPLIVSASRATDIPAFYSEWFFNRINEGYVKWINPFNRRSQYISFEQARVMVFWTKDAEPIMGRLKELDERGINYYFQYTLNDYEEEGLEENIPPLGKRIETFKELSKMLGRERVIWRFDPLMLMEDVGVNDLLAKIKKVGDAIHKYTEKLVFSFADISTYLKVERNLKRYGIKYTEFQADDMVEVAKGLRSMNLDWGLEMATCSEEIDLAQYGIKKNKCIDDELMTRMFQKDEVLMEFLGAPDAQQLTLIGEPKKKDNLKDKGQRKACGCIVSKDIGQYNTCNHKCLYCYANYSEAQAESNYNQYRSSSKNNESILSPRP